MMIERQPDGSMPVEEPLEDRVWRQVEHGLAHAIGTGKSKQKKNAEAMLVRTVRGWLEDVAELCPERIHDLRRIVEHGIANPAPAPRREDGQKGR